MAMTVQDIEQQIQETLHALARDGIATQHQTSVCEYFFSHPALLQTVPEVIHLARQDFGPDAHMELEVDASSGRGNEYLVLLIRQSQYDQRFLDALNAASKAATSRVSKPDWRFVVTSDFIPA